MPHRLDRAFATVSGLTGLSRILGLVRDQMLAAFVGPSLVLDAWLVAFSLPNAARRIFAEGAMSAAFVPMLRDRLTKGGAREAKAFARAAFAFLILVLTPLIATLILLMPWVLDLILQESAPEPTRTLSLIFARIMLPYLLFMSLMALVGGVLDVLGKFAAKALAPSLFNLVMIATLTVLAVLDRAPGLWLSWATLMAGALQLLVVWVPAARLGWAPALVWPRGLGPFARRMVPGMVARGGYQISFLVVLSLAATVEQDVSYRYLADRVYQLPLGLIGIALNTILLSSLANLIAQGQDAAARRQCNRGLELAMLLALPITFACCFLGEFLFQGLFEVGQFTAADSRGAATALLGFALGIPAAVGQMVIQPTFFARQNTRDPMIHSLVAVAVAIVGSYALYPALGLFGLALAASLSSWVGFLSLLTHALIFGHVRPDRQLLVRLIPMTVASAAMVLLLKGLLILLGDLSRWAFALRVPLTLGLIALAAGAYFAMTLLLGALNKADLRNTWTQS